MLVETILIHSGMHAYNQQIHIRHNLDHAVMPRLAIAILIVSIIIAFLAIADTFENPSLTALSMLILAVFVAVIAVFARVEETSRTVLENA